MKCFVLEGRSDLLRHPPARSSPSTPRNGQSDFNLLSQREFFLLATFGLSWEVTVFGNFLMHRAWHFLSLSESAASAGGLSAALLCRNHHLQQESTSTGC